jgi:magnesium chelatase family protein
VAIVRARHSAVYPARFMLIAATNPCPCGYAGEQERCRCSEADIARHRRRLSGPLLDRIDLLVSMERPDPFAFGRPSTTSSVRLREKVQEARERQEARLRAEAITVNAQMDARMLRAYIPLDRACEEILAGAHKQRMLSMRGAHRALRVARTIADLDGSQDLSSSHLTEALCSRPEACLSRRRAA